ncbi:hypothetical protein BDF19DRAFT_430280 [Syncephalis fuscata]|nr:hypothetical protein BDF19DRAFT_430280 [Syncephalis fuscata]
MSSRQRLLYSFSSLNRRLFSLPASYPLVVIPAASAVIAIVTTRFQPHIRRPFVSSTRLSMAAASSNGGDDAYLRFLQQANAPLQSAGTASVNTDEVAPHTKALTDEPTDAALSAAQQRLNTAASGLCLISETESDLSVVHIPAPAFEATSLTDQQFAELLGAEHEECVLIDVKEFIANAKNAAASVGLANDVVRWTALPQVFADILGTTPLKAWRVGRAADAWIYIGGILPGKGFVGVRAHSVET